MLVDRTAHGVSFEVIRRVRAGDRTAFAELVHLCRQRVTGIIRRMISYPEDVEDVAQEVFFRMYTSIGQLRTPESFDFWAYRLTVNGAYDYLRKRPRHQHIRMAELKDCEVDMASAAASWQVLRNERDRLRAIDFVDGLLSHLSPSDRILIVLREVEGLTMEELSGVLGVRIGAVKARLFRARNRLRQVLNPPAGRAAPLLASAVLTSPNT